MDTHTDDFIEQRPGLMQPIIRSAVSRREGPTAFFTAVPPPSALGGDVERVSNDVAFAGLASQRAIGVGTATRSSSVPLHTCLIAEKPEKIQLAQEIGELLDTVNNTSLKKHQRSREAKRLGCCAFCGRPLELSVSSAGVRIFRCVPCGQFGQATNLPRHFRPRKRELRRKRRRWQDTNSL